MSSLSYPLNQVEFSLGKGIAYVGSCIIARGSHFLHYMITRSFDISLRAISFLCSKYAIKRFYLCMLTFMFYIFNQMAILH